VLLEVIREAGGPVGGGGWIGSPLPRTQPPVQGPTLATMRRSARRGKKWGSVMRRQSVARTGRNVTRNRPSAEQQYPDAGGGRSRCGPTSWHPPSIARPSPRDTRPRGRAERAFHHPGTRRVCPFFWYGPLAHPRARDAAPAAVRGGNRLHARKVPARVEEDARILLGRNRLPRADTPVLARALEPFPAPVRTRDALHLASLDHLSGWGSASSWQTYDTRQAAAARRMGVALVDAGARLAAAPPRSGGISRDSKPDPSTRSSIDVSQLLIPWLSWRLPTRAPLRLPQPGSGRGRVGRRANLNDHFGRCGLCGDSTATATTIWPAPPPDEANGLIETAAHGMVIISRVGAGD